MESSRQQAAGRPAAADWQHAKSQPGAQGLSPSSFMSCPWRAGRGGQAGAGRRGEIEGASAADQRAASNAECQMSKYMVKMCQLSYLIWSRCYFITPNVRLYVSVVAAAAAAVAAAAGVAAVRASAHNERCCSKAAGRREGVEGARKVALAGETCLEFNFHTN